MPPLDAYDAHHSRGVAGGACLKRRLAEGRPPSLELPRPPANNSVLGVSRPRSLPLAEARNVVLPHANVEEEDGLEVLD